MRIENNSFIIFSKKLKLRREWLEPSCKIYGTVISYILITNILLILISEISSLLLTSNKDSGCASNDVFIEFLLQNGQKCRVSQKSNAESGKSLLWEFEELNECQEVEFDEHVQFRIILHQKSNFCPEFLQIHLKDADKTLLISLVNKHFYSKRTNRKWHKVSKAWPKTCWKTERPYI